MKVLILFFPIICAYVSSGLTLYIALCDVDRLMAGFEKSPAIKSFKGCTEGGSVLARLYLVIHVTTTIVWPKRQMIMGRLDPSEIEKLPVGIRVRALLSKWLVYMAIFSALALIGYGEALERIPDAFK